MIELLKKVKRAVSAALLRVKIRREARCAFQYDIEQFMHNAGALHMDCQGAACAEIVMGYHVLEKGLTMPKRRLGFGKGAVVRLMQLIDAFERRFGSGNAQVHHAIGVLRAYRELHRDWPEPMPRLDAFLAAHADVPAAIEAHVSRADFFAAKNAAFAQFAASRHVVRHFAGPVPKQTIEAAVALAITAPSACNRQHARVHVIDDPGLRDQILALQGGTRGFGADIDKLIVVTADLHAIRWAWERHDAYVNGGIFVMNLCYALHWHGVAHCILHWSVPPKSDIAVHEILGIPANEVIVQLIACGAPPEEFDVAASPRRAVGEILTWHGDRK